MKTNRPFHILAAVLLFGVLAAGHALARPVFIYEESAYIRTILEETEDGWEVVTEWGVVCERGANSTASAPYRVQTGVLVLVGATNVIAQALSATGGPLLMNGVVVEFSSSAQVAAKIQALHPADTGHVWLGFQSTQPLPPEPPGPGALSFKIKYSMQVQTTDWNATGAGWLSNDTDDLQGGDVTDAYSVFIQPPTLSYTNTILPGFNLIANQVDSGDNTLNAVLPIVPPGSQLFKWVEATGAFHTDGYPDPLVGWSDSTGLPSATTLGPREAAFLFNPGPAYQLTFSGSPRTNDPPPPVLSREHYHYLSGPIKHRASYTNITGLPPEEGALVLRWIVLTQSYQTNRFTGGAWHPAEPIAEVGEGVVIWLPLAAPPVITSQPQSQTVTQGQTAAFTVAVSGGAPLQYHWIFCPRPFWDWTLPPIPLATIGPALTLGNVQSVDAGDYLVVVSNESGSVTSTVARLTFVPATSCLVFAGLEHCPAGAAGVNASSNSLFISNIGSSGQDGVAVNLFKGLNWEAHWRPLDPTDALPVGAYVQSQAYGTAGTVSNGLLGTWRETKAGTSNYVVTADFSPIGATTVTLQVYNGSTLVASISGQSGALCRINGCVDDDHWGHPVPTGGPFGGGLTMFGPTDIIFPDGGTLQGDRLVILPEGAPPVSSLSSVKVTASQIPQIVITNEQVRELGVPLWVAVGIRSYVCLLFGACQIGLDAPTNPAESARAIPAAARWINGHLQLSFLAEPPDKTNVFTISEDIVLSVATAQALGHQQVTVHAGSYPMDYSVNPHGQVSPDVTVQGIVIGGTFTIGRKSLNCRRFGFCRLEEIKIEFEPPSEARTIPGGITWVNGHLQFNFLAEPPDKTNVLTIDEDIVLDTVLAQSLGYQHITVLAGNYPMDYAVNPHGAVSPDVTAQDVVLGGTFTIGRKRYGCERFGLCRLEEVKVEFELGSNARTIPGGFTWHNGQLDLNFLAEPPGKTNLLTIDEDIVLSSVLAQSLGYQRLTVLAGDYPVDYSVNPHGQVSPRVSTTPVTILQNTNGTIAIAWPADATNLELEGTDSISPPIVWLPVNAVVQEMNGRRVVTLPISSTPRFFRLRGPGVP